MAIEQYKKISEMIPNDGGYDGLGNAWFPYVITEDDGTTILNNYKVKYDELSSSVLGKIETLSLLTNGTLQTQYNGSFAKSFNVTPSNIGTYAKQEIDKLLEEIVPKSFVKYEGPDPLTTSTYVIDPERNMMYSGNFNNNTRIVLQALSNTESYGSTFLFLRNTDVNNFHTITIDSNVLGGTYYLPDNTPDNSYNEITVPANMNVEIISRSYGGLVVITYRLSVPDQIERRIQMRLETDSQDMFFGEEMVIYRVEANNVSSLSMTIGNTETSINVNTNVNVTIPIRSIVTFNVTRQLTDAVGYLYIKAKTKTI